MAASVGVSPGPARNATAFHFSELPPRGRAQVDSIATATAHLRLIATA